MVDQGIASTETKSNCNRNEKANRQPASQKNQAKSLSRKNDNNYKIIIHLNEQRTQKKKISFSVDNNIYQMVIG